MKSDRIRLSQQQSYSFEDLVEIMSILRSEDGCPWDKEQTHESIRKNLIEETYEVVEAIDEQDFSMLREELGDVLLQVIFHAQIEQEAGRFDLTDVIEGICRKLIFRHPHIFGTEVVENSGEVLRNWDTIKQKEKGYDSCTEALKRVPRQFPALMRSQKIQHKAAKAGFDWESISGPIEKVREEISEVEEAIRRGDRGHAVSELGDLLFAAVNVGRFLKADCEEALTGANERFISRFSYVEQKATESGRDLGSMTLEEMNVLWEEAKRALQ